MPESPIDNFWLHEAGRMPGPSSMPAANSPARKKNLLDPYHSIASSLFNGGNANEVFLAAARDGDYEKIESLLLRRNEALVSIDVRDQNTGNTPIIWAAKRGHVKIVQLLLKHSADITLRNYEGQTALEVASPQIRSVLLESVEKGGSHRNLLQAAWQGNANLVKKILAENRAVDINCRNADGLTPLLLVTRDVQLFEKLGDRINRGYKPDQVVQELLAHRADPNAVDNEGKTPLHYVSSSKAKQAKALVEKLLQDGSDYNAQDRRCFTPIHHASQSGNVDVVLALLDGGSDANARGFAGATPLHISAINGHDEVAGALLNNGGDVTLVDDSGLTPVEVAKTKKVKATLKNAWTEVVRSRSETSLGPVRTPSVSSIRRSQEFESPLNIIKKKKGGEVIFDETEEIFELELAGSPSSTLTGAVQRLDAVMKNSGVLQSVSLPSPSNAVESMTPRKVAMIAQLTHAEKALKAEEQMLKDLSEGRFTPNKYQNIFLSRETTRLLGNSRSSSSSASRRTPQPPRTPRGVSLSPIKSVTTPRKKGSGKKEIKFGPGTKMEDGNKARTGSACNKHSTVERTASDPSKGPAGMKECQIPVTILGLDLDDNLQEIRVKRIVQGPIGHVLQKKGHVRQHSDPLPPDMFTVNEDLLRGRSSSKSSVLSNSDDWEEINARHHSPTRTPSGDKSRHFNLDTIEEGKVSKKQPLILDLDQMQLTNHPRTPIMGDSNLYTYPASKKLLPATPTYRSQEFGDSMKLVDMSAEFAMSDSTSSTDSSDKSDEEEEDDDDDDEDEEEDDEEEESGSESSEDEVRIALPNPTDLLRSKSILKQHFNIEESRVHLSEDKTKTRQSNRSSTSSGLGTEASSSSSSNRSSMASSVGASASADTSPTPASESQVLCNGPVDGVISQVITGPDNKQTRGQATSKTTSNINKKNCGGVAAKAKLSNAEAAAKLQTAAKQNAVNACKSSQSSKVGTNTQQQAAKSSANANKITVHNTLLDTENKSTKVQESKTTGSAASQNKTPATTPKVNGTITSNHQGLKTSNSNSQPLSTAGKDNKHFQSGSSQLAQETLVKTSVAPKAGNQASVSAKPAACQGTLNVDATQERKPCQQKPTVKTPQYAPNQTPQNKTVSAGAKATTAGTGSKPAEGPKPSEQAKVSIVKSATSTPQTTASAASVTKSTPNITSSGSEKPMSTSPMRNSAPVSSTNKSEVSAAKTPQVSSSAPTNQPSQPNSVAKPSHKVVPEPVGQVVKPSTVAKPVGVQHLQVQAAKLHDSPNHSNSGTPQGSPAPARKPGSNSTTRCQAGGSHSPVHSTGKTGDLKYSGSISSAKIISERPSSAKNKGAAVGGRPLSGKSAGRPASGKKHKIQGGNINVDKVLEHTPKICDPFETIKAQQSMEAAASQEQSIAGANTSRAQNRCGGKNRQALVPSKNYSLKDKHQEPRQTSGNRKRGSKSKEVKTNNSNSQAQVKIKRPKSGKRCRSKKKRKGGKDKDIEFNEADPSKVAYISGIGWSVKTNCNERGDDVHAVQVAIDTDDSSDSEDDITLMADKSDASRSSRSRGSKAPRHAFNQDSTDDTCTDEEVEDLADAEVVHDEVIFLQPAAVREQMAKEEKEEKNSSSGKKLEHGGDREKVWAAEMNARAVSPTTNMPSLIPRTISAIEAFSKAVTDDQLNDMLESGAATPVNTGYTLPNEVEKDVKAQAKISSATTHAAKPVPAGGKPKPQVAPKPAKGAGGQTGATQSNRNSATTKPANQTAKPVSKAVTQGTKPITKTQAQPTQPGGRAPSQAQAKPKLTTQTSQPGSSTQGPKTQAPSTQSVSKGLQRQTSLTKAPPRPPPPASKIPTSPAKAPNQATRPASHVTNQSQPSPTKTAATSQPAAKASPQLNTKVPPPRPPPPAKPTIKPESVTTDTRGKDASPQFQNTKESMKGSEKKPEVSDQQQACVKGSSAGQLTNHSSQPGAQGQVKNETEKKSLNDEQQWSRANEKDNTQNEETTHQVGMEKGENTEQTEAKVDQKPPPAQSDTERTGPPIRPPRRKKSKKKGSKNDEDEEVQEAIAEIFKNTPDPTLSMSWRSNRTDVSNSSTLKARISPEDIRRSIKEKWELDEIRKSQDKRFCEVPVSQTDVKSTGGGNSGEGDEEQNKEVVEKFINSLKRMELSVKLEKEQSGKDASNVLEPKAGGTSPDVAKPPIAPKHSSMDSPKTSKSVRPKTDKSPRFVRKQDSFKEVQVLGDNPHGGQVVPAAEGEVMIHLQQATPLKEFDTMSDASMAYSDMLSIPSTIGDDLEDGRTVTSRIGRRSARSVASRAGSSMTTESSQGDLDDMETIAWKKGNMLGKGAYGTVWCGLTNNGELIAVKQIELNTNDMEKAELEYEKIQEEVELLKALKHKNIVGYLGTSLEDNIVSIFMQFVPGGSIANILARFGVLEEEVFCHYTKQILEGVEYLHQNDVIHRDIKGGNIMLMPNSVIKLIDFGCAKRLCINVSVSQNRLLRSMRGTPYWMAPEVVSETGHGTKSDIWSIGCTVFEMATRKPPWADMPPMAAIFAIGSDKPIPQLPEKFSYEAKSFVNACLIRDQTLRPSATALLQHPFIANKRRR